jgi:hypothetical protein
MSNDTLRYAKIKDFAWKARLAISAAMEFDEPVSLLVREMKPGLTRQAGSRYDPHEHRQGIGEGTVLPDLPVTIFEHQGCGHRYVSSYIQDGVDGVSCVEWIEPLILRALMPHA